MIKAKRANRARPNEHPSIEATELHRVAREEALAFVDQQLGPANEWPSPLIRYPLSAEFQTGEGT
jgi:hypothetical protein